MKRFRPAKITVRYHSRNSKKTCKLPVIVKGTGHSRAAALSLGDVDAVVEETECENQVSQHERRSISSINNWAAIRMQLVSAYVEGSCIPPNATCSLCMQPAIIRCLQCGPKQTLCKSCCLNAHSEINHFHVPEIWKDGTFVPFVMAHKRNIMRIPHHNCDASNWEVREITVIDIQGNHHFKQVETCHCEKISVTLLRYGLWPGSPEKPTIAFKMELMELLRVFFIHCKVSLNEMTEVLELTRHRLLPKLTSSLYSTLNSGCFEEYRFFYHKINDLNYLDQRVYDGTWCPVCPQENGVLIQSMDACFGLYRKKSKGYAVMGADSRHKNRLFADQDDVDNFVNNYSGSLRLSDPDIFSVNKECNNFHAGEVSSALRSKGKNKLLDEKAVFGRVCRHDFPKGFLNIKHGERISYSVYECKRILEEVKGKPNINVIVMYDIACILDVHIKRNTALKELAALTLAIPIFHCYGHKGSCQVQYSPRRTKSIGLTDGEGTERLWAFLRDYSRITKEMGTHKRNDVLTDGLIHYGQQLLSKQAIIIKGRFRRATELLEKTTKELNELTSSLPTTFTYNSSTMDILISQEQKDFQKKKQGPLTWDEQYADLLTQQNRIRHGIASSDDADEVEKLQKKMARTEKALQSIEKGNGIRRRWEMNSDSFLHSNRQLTLKRSQESLVQIHTLASERTFILELKKKYADGQAVAKKISKCIEQATTSLKKALSRHNALTSSNDISFDDAKDPLSRIYSSIHIALESSTRNMLPNSLRRKLIDAHCVRERCEEEIFLLKTEVTRLSSFYKNQITVLDEVLSSTDHAGVHSIVRKKKICIIQVMYQLKATLCDGFPDTNFFIEGSNSQSYELSTDGTCIFPITTELNDNTQEYENDSAPDDSDDPYEDDLSSDEEEFNNV